MKSSISIILECPFCRKPTGYHITREGVVYSREIMGRFGKESIRCVHCGGEIQALIQVVYEKKR